MNTSTNWATDKDFKNKFSGQNGLVIGRGQGKEYLRNEKLDAFNGIKIGCNSAYKTTSIDALVWMDPHFFEMHWMEIAQIQCLKFAVEPLHYDHHFVDIIGIHSKQPERCTESFESGFYPCNLSGYLALNIALLFGLNPIWLYGFDPDTESLKKRSESFNLIAGWADKSNVQIFTMNKNSYLNKFFSYKEFPIKQSSLKRRGLDVRSQKI